MSAKVGLKQRVLRQRVSMRDKAIAKANKSWQNGGLRRAKKQALQHQIVKAAGELERAKD